MTKSMLRATLFSAAAVGLAAAVVVPTAANAVGGAGHPDPVGCSAKTWDQSSYRAEECVELWQTFLKYGYKDLYRGDIDGRFRTNTSHATAGWQRQFDIDHKEKGFVGVVTNRKACSRGVEDVKDRLRHARGDERDNLETAYDAIRQYCKSE